MTQSIQDAIAQAKEAAANSLPSGALATQAGNTSIGVPMTSGAPLDVDDMLSSGVSVDHWLKFSEHGIAIGDKTKPMDDLVVYLDMSEIAYCYQIKYQLNGAAKYHRSYDRVTENGGGSWMETIRQAQQIDAKAYEYRSAEIPVVASESYSNKDGVTVNAGDRLGLTLPTTGWKPFEGFLRDLKKAGVDIKTGVVRLTLGHKVMTKAGVKPWAIPQFLSFEEIDALPVFDTVH